MKNTPVSILGCVCIILSAFMIGMFVGRNLAGGSIQTSVLSTSNISQGSVTGSTPSSPSTASTSASQSDKININTADLYTLMSLPGIGETLSNRIIAYREDNGNFQSIEDLMNVNGIGEAKFEQIQNYITTGGQP